MYIVKDCHAGPTAGRVGGKERLECVGADT